MEEPTCGKIPSCEEFTSLWIDICPSVIPLKLDSEATLGVFHSKRSFIVASGHSVKSFIQCGKQFQEISDIQFRSLCTCTAWNSANNSLFLGFQDGAILSWKGKEGKSVRKLNKKTHRAVSCIETSSQVVASGTVEGRINVFDTTVGKCVGMTRAHIGSIICLRLVENTRLMASFGRDNFGKLWSLDRLDSPRHIVGGDVKLPQTIVHVDRDRSKPEVFYIASDKAIHIWDIRVGGITAVLSEPISALSLKYKRRITCMQVLSNGSIVTGNSDGSLLYWPECGPWNGIEILSPSYLSITSIASDSYKFLLGWEDGSVKLINNPLEFSKVDEERLLTKYMNPIQKLDLIEKDRVIVMERFGRVSALDFSVDSVRGRRMDTFCKWLNAHPICKPHDARTGAVLSGKFWK